MGEVPLFVLVLLVPGVIAFGVLGLRGLLDILDALRHAELTRLAAPLHWPVTRAFFGACTAVPVYLATASLGTVALGSAATTAALGYAVAPRFRDALRQRAAQALLDELALHLDLFALAVEAGGSLSSALSACSERAPDGALRRCWSRAVLEVHAGAPVHDVLRDLDLRIGVRAFSSFVTALRCAERAGADAAVVLRERARQAAASRFARAEQRARAAPLRLWATLMLCIAPCTLLVLAFPVARLMAFMVER